MVPLEPRRAPSRSPSAGLPFWAVLAVAGAVLVVGLGGDGSRPVEARGGDAGELARGFAERGDRVAAAEMATLDPVAAGRRSHVGDGGAVALGEAATSRGQRAGSRPDTGSSWGPFEPVEARPGSDRSPLGDDDLGGAAHEEGSFRAGLRHGPWVSRWPDGALRDRGSYDQGRRVGAWEFFGPGGTLLTFVEYDAGERHGDWRAYAPDGTLVGEGEHRRNLRHGPWTLHYTDGRIKERGTYANGLREGLWEFFDDLGTLTARSGTYRAGIKID